MPPRRTVRAILLAALALASATCGGPTRRAVGPADPPAVEVPGETTIEATGVARVPLAGVGLDPDALDPTADPCQDFYQFACGGWIARTEIPGDEVGWWRGFSEIRKRNEADLRGILEGAAATPDGGDPVLARLGAFYGACMDEATAEAQGLKPVRALLARVAKVKDAATLGAAVTELHRHGVWALFDITGDQDFLDATKVIAHLDQNGLGLPDRDYYLNDDAKTADTRAAYRAHVERMFRLYGLGKGDARRAALDVVTIEKALAKVSKSRVERRDPKGMYNKLDRSGLLRVATRFPWEAYFAGLGVPDLVELSVTSVPYFEGMNALLASTKPEAWRSYLTWHVLHATAPSLSRAFVDEAFKLDALLSGQAKIKDRWRRCLDETDEALGELLAQPFVAARFRPEAKEAAEGIIAGISQAFGANLKGLPWMDARTRGRALEKLAAVVFKIGYPARWRTYDFPVDRKDHASNVLAARAFERARRLARIGKPVDREEWEMTPPTVNAYYNPLKNEMVFPAGILQPPYFDAAASVVVNLGAIGMVVGHELTHGFDDEGSQFNAVGNLQNWWEPDVARRFGERTRCVVDQYAAYEAVPGIRLNGELTLGENIADIGGVKIAFRAYRALRAGATEVTVADASAGGRELFFTEDQQFFLSVGQAWCAKIRDETAQVRVKVDPHSPPRWRVNGALADVPEFAAAFECAAATPMNPAKVCEVW